MRPSDQCPHCAGKGCQECDWFGTRATVGRHNIDAGVEEW